MTGSAVVVGNELRAVRLARISIVMKGCMSSLPVAHPGYQILSDILFRLGLIANCFHTVQYLDCSDLN